ncbi:MAG: helix-turn-helix transcriptional regulator [Lachnospiraceae bacterium]|nr:helix-turn-helix transcriptional regulator [Lachnospiraceae bacterium]
MKIRDDYTCPLEIVHDLIRGKWKAIIIFQLQFGNASLSTLKRDIVGISEKMLLQQLGELSQYGILGKFSSQGFPLSVEYFLTERGWKLVKAVNIMQEVGVDFMVELGQTDFLDQKGIPYRKI